MEREQSKRIRQFILEEVRNHPRDIVRHTEVAFQITRQAVNRHINNMVKHGLLIAEGSTRQRQYKLKPIVEQEIPIPVSKYIKEDVIWRESIRPLLGEIPKNILEICNYGFTEIFNNVIDHSSAILALIKIVRTAIHIKITIFDNGIGIFKKIQTELGLDDQRHSILELAKGKLTTDPERHTGEGIFFSSRMFDRFSIYSSGLFFTHNEIGHDWLLGDAVDTDDEGTLIVMEIQIKSTRTIKEVFDKFSSEDDDYGFTRTIVPVILAKYGDENLVSRSQAKRLLARFEKFKEVILDFSEVETIGQAFADEIFRVFRNQNPDIHLMPNNANEEVQKSIKRALNQQQ